MERKLKAVVLAAGKGTRLNSESHDLPKVMRVAAGRPLLAYVLSAIDFIGAGNTVIVVGYKKEAVISAFPGYTFAEQSEQLGTGHAVMAAAGALSGFDGSILVCCGDMPLIKRESLLALVEAHFSESNVCTILSGTSDEPLDYGRIVMDESGSFLRMVEHRDCSEEERKIRELNSGVYIFDAPSLLGALSKLRRNNAQGEYYLTDVPEILNSEGKKVGVCRRHLGSELLGVNTPEQLNRVEQLLKEEAN
jgi:UDP-N-acetylglucosamine diphosphorylase/glucosamine-1-phosphate N-acetyltransferase